jgi:dephospho-CoA kinase
VDENSSIARKPVIGLAGGVGAGKSAVAQILSRLGCVVCNSDDLARQALRDPAIRAELVTWWGNDVLDRDGEIDRAAVAAIVFSRPPELRRLESLVHPWIEAQRKTLFEMAPADVCALVIDAPLLFEAGLDAECDAVIFVDADRETRLARVAEGRGWDEQELGKREDSQLPLDEKRTRSDYVVSNNGDLRALSEQVHRTLNEIVQNRRR